jgi:GLPGLI family protein
MKFKIALITLFFLSIKMYAQDFTITYNKEIKEVFSEKIRTADPEMKRINDEVVKEAKNIKYDLKIVKNTSSFELSESVNNSPLVRICKTFGGLNGDFFVDKKLKKRINIKTTMGEKFQVALDDREWKIHKETKQIGKYTCYKATGIDFVRKFDKVNKIPVTVWFCPELPSYFGPGAYFGLPGTILRVEKRKVTIFASHIEEIKDAKAIKIHNKGIKVTEDELHEISINGTPDFGVGN